MALVAAALAGNTSVTSLCLGVNHIGAGGAGDLAEALTQNSTLSSLDLRGNNLRSRGAERLAGALLRNSSLTAIDLRGNGIMDSGAQCLAQALKENAMIESLNLARNPIGREGIQSLLEVVETSSITNLRVDDLSLSLPDQREAASQVAVALDKKRPRLVLNVEQSDEQVVCSSCLTGSVLATLAPNDTLPALSHAVAAETGTAEDDLLFVRGDGARLWQGDANSKATLAELLSWSAEDLPSQSTPAPRLAYDVEPDLVREAARQRIAEGERRAREAQQRLEELQLRRNNRVEVKETQPQVVRECGVFGCLQNSLPTLWGRTFGQ